MENNIESLFERMLDKNEKEAFKYATQLASIGSPEVFEKAIALLKGKDMEDAYFAVLVLSKTENRQMALDPLLEAILDRSNLHHNGALVANLEAFDLHEKFVDILRIYLFGNFKASTLAKEYLDHTEFDITPRIIKKAEKHWNHYKNNSKHDEVFEVKEREIEAIFHDLESLFDGTESKE